MKNAVLLKFNSLQHARVALSRIKAASKLRRDLVLRKLIGMTNPDLHDPKSHSLSLSDGCAGILMIYPDERTALISYLDIFNKMVITRAQIAMTTRIELHDCTPHNPGSVKMKGAIKRNPVRRLPPYKKYKAKEFRKGLKLGEYVDTDSVNDHRYAIVWQVGLGEPRLWDANHEKWVTKDDPGFTKYSDRSIAAHDNGRILRRMNAKFGMVDPDHYRIVRL